MDIVKIVDAAIARLSEGEHSLGLKAVKRHIAAAIRHFERDDGGDVDAFTDTIYRTNQAFEGGLKEAYRVLAEKDPAKLSPFEIENYLETNRLIRPRALKQLTRYREDYRNPSTHDYKLDFDEDEALLAIVSVCAFTKLLVNQISNKLAFVAASALPPTKLNRDISSKSEFILLVTDIIKQSLETVAVSSMDPEGLDGFINGALASNGLNTFAKLETDIIEDDGSFWDIVASKDDFSLPVEIRIAEKSNIDRSFGYLIEKSAEEKLDSALIVVVPQKADHEKFRLYRCAQDNGTDIFAITTAEYYGKLRRREKPVFRNMKLFD